MSPMPGILSILVLGLAEGLLTELLPLRSETFGERESGIEIRTHEPSQGIGSRRGS